MITAAPSRLFVARIIDRAGHAAAHGDVPALSNAEARRLCRIARLYGAASFALYFRRAARRFDIPAAAVRSQLRFATREALAA